MGPYYLTALVFLLGPIRRVTGLARTGDLARVVATGPKAGMRIPVETETHVAAVVEHESGAVVTLTTSYDTWAEESSFELWGTDGTLVLADPNRFEGELAIVRRGSAEAERVSPWAGPAGAARGYGLADLVAAHGEGRPHRVCGELAFHVLDALSGILESAREARVVELSSGADQPKPLSAEEVERWRAVR
jgi:predicted dehydrogenase